MARKYQELVGIPPRRLAPAMAQRKEVSLGRRQNVMVLVAKAIMGAYIAN